MQSIRSKELGWISNWYTQTLPGLELSAILWFFALQKGMIALMIIIEMLIMMDDGKAHVLEPTCWSLWMIRDSHFPRTQQSIWTRRVDTTWSLVGEMTYSEATLPMLPMADGRISFYRSWATIASFLRLLAAGHVVNHSHCFTDSFIQSFFLSSFFLFFFLYSFFYFSVFSFLIISFILFISFLYSFFPFHFIPCYFILCDFICSFYFISFHLILFHVILFHFIWFDVFHLIFISLYFMSSHCILFHFISCHVIFSCIILFDFILVHFTSFHFSSSHFISFIHAFMKIPIKSHSASIWIGLRSKSLLPNVSHFHRFMCVGSCRRIISTRHTCGILWAHRGCTSGWCDSQDLNR